MQPDSQSTLLALIIDASLPYPGCIECKVFWRAGGLIAGERAVAKTADLQAAPIKTMPSSAISMIDSSARYDKR